MSRSPFFLSSRVFFAGKTFLLGSAVNELTPFSSFSIIGNCSYDRVRPCKLVELGYSPHLSRRGTVPKPPKPEELRDLISPPAKNLFSADTVTPPLAPGDAGRGSDSWDRG